MIRMLSIIIALIAATNVLAIDDDNAEQQKLRLAKLGEHLTELGQKINSDLYDVSVADVEHLLNALYLSLEKNNDPQLGALSLKNPATNEDETTAQQKKLLCIVGKNMTELGQKITADKYDVTLEDAVAMLVILSAFLEHGDDAQLEALPVYFINKESSTKEKLAYQIQKSTLDLEALLIEFKNGSFGYDDVPASFFGYHCHRFNNDEKFQTSDITPLMWLVVRGGDDEFYAKALMSSTWTEPLLQTVNHRCRRNCSALMMAIKRSSEKIIQFLLDEGLPPIVGTTETVATVPQKIEFIEVSKKDESSKTALVYAIEKVSVHGTKFAHRLLAAGADVKKNPLVFFVLAGGWETDIKIELLEAFLRRGATVNTRDMDCGSPLNFALKNRMEQRILRTLMNYGGSVPYSDKKQLLPIFESYAPQEHGEDDLLFSIRRRLVTMVTNCLAKSSDKKGLVNRKTRCGTALDYALVTRNKEIIHALLDAGADPLTGMINGLFLASISPEWQTADDHLKHRSIYHRMTEKYVLALLVFDRLLLPELARFIVAIQYQLPGQEIPYELCADSVEPSVTQAELN